MTNGFHSTGPFAGGRLIADSSGGYGPNVARIEYSEGSFGGNAFRDPPNVWESAWSGGSGACGFTSGVLPANVREVYFAGRMRFSANYEMHTAAFTEKFWYPRFTTGEIGQTPIIQFAGVTDGSNVPPYRVGTSYYDGASGSIIQNKSAAVIPRGEWFNIEIHQRINSYNAVRALDDGFSKVWINGTLLQDVQNWRGALMSQQIYYETGLIASTRGGGGSSIVVPTGGMYRDLDRIALFYKVGA
jgi:hypothetical protein